MKNTEVLWTDNLFSDTRQNVGCLSLQNGQSYEWVGQCL